jgi:capsular exopolysaccharide synthesis family protein
MSLQVPQSSNNNLLADKVQIQRTLKAFRTKWFVPLIILVGVIIIVKIYVRYRTNSFTSNSTIEIIEDSNPSEFLSIDLFESAFSRTDKVLTEAEVIKTKSVVRLALDNMNYKVVYSKAGTFNSYELYRRTPFKIVTDSKLLQKPSIRYELELLSLDKYRIGINTEEGKTVIEGAFNQPVEFQKEIFSIEISTDQYAHDIEPGNQYEFNFVNLDLFTEILQSRVQIVQPRDHVSILQISFTWNNAIFAQDFSKSLVEVYLLDDYLDKSKMASNVINFIDVQLEELSKKVDSYESKISNFKSENTLVDIESEAGQSMRALYELETEKRLIEVEILTLESLSTQLENHGNESVTRLSTEGLVDPTLIKTISDLNSLELEKLNIVDQSGPKNKRLLNINQQIEELTNNLTASVNTGIIRLKSRKGYFDNQIKAVYEEFKEIPGFQKEYLNLSRNFEVNEKVFALLLERKLSAQISKAAIVPNVKMLDSPNFPVKSNGIPERRLLVLSGISALLFGLSLVAVTSFFDEKIYSKEELEASTSIPIIGQLSQAKANDKNIIIKATDKSRSIFSESIKSLRTNLDFFIQSQAKGARVICTTSTVSGEGKSFITANLAYSYASLGKKTILVDLDMRKPRVHDFFNVANEFGISNVLIGVKSIKEVIRHDDTYKLDFICAGVIPPNPGELLQSSKFGEVIDYLKSQYDVVLLDTPPIGIISDSLFAMKQALSTLYVVKANYSKVNFLNVPKEIMDNHKLSNFHIVLNAVEHQRSGYGGYSSSYYYKSGYFEDNKKRGFFARLFRKK